MGRRQAQQTRSALIGCMLGCVATAVVAGLAVLLLSFGDEDKPDRWFSESELIRALNSLELAELQTKETVERTERAESNLPVLSTVLGWLDAEATLMIRFQVLYTYVVDLNGEWRFDQRDDLLLVTAPTLVAKTPAIDTATIEQFSNGSWLIWDKEGKQKELQETLTAVAHERAATKINLVLEASRRTLEEFLRQWAGNEGRHLGRIEIQFANEIEPESQARG